MKIREAAGVLERIGVVGYNKPKKTPNHPTKSHVVVAKEGDNVTPIGIFKIIKISCKQHC